MVTIQKVDNAIRFTFVNSSFYLYDNGTVDVPLNALTLVLDEADMANFVKASSNDNLFSIPMSELSQFADKAALQSWFEENAFVGSAGVSPEDVQTAIDTALAPVNEDITALSNEIDEKEEVTARALHDLHETKQDKLTAGNGITIVDNVISAEGGSSVTVDPTLDSGSTNPVANSAITAAMNAKQGTLTAGSGISISSDTISCTYPIYVNQYADRGDITFGKSIVNIQSDYYRLAIGQKIRSGGNSGFEGSIGIGLATGNSGQYNQLYGADSIGIGRYFNIGNDSLFSNTVRGAIAIGAKTTVRNSNGLAIGTNTTVSGTTKTNINNQITVDTNNQVYVKDKTNTNDICLQDYLQVKLVKCTQAEYDAIVQGGTVDANTLYVITNVV